MDLYIASAPVVGAWCACNNGAMELTYERRWNGSSRDPIEDVVEV